MKARELVLLGVLGLCAGCVTVSGGAASAKLTPREQAQVYLSRGDGKNALPILTGLFAAQPQDLALARMLAEAHVKAGSADAFLATLAGKDTAIAHYQQGLVRFTRSADTAPALTEFKRAAELSPGEPEFAYRLGVAQLESEQYPEARQTLEGAVAAAKERTAWSLPLAKARHRTGEVKGAVEAVRVAVVGGVTPAEAKTARALMDQIADPFAGFPRSARPQLEQAIQWLEINDVPQQAIVQLEELLRDLPDEAVLHSLLGLAYARLDDAGRAVDELKRAIELQPEDGKNYLYLAQIYEGRQRQKNAEEQYLKALERNPVLDEAWFKLGDLALERQDFVTARKNFEIASRLVPENVPAHGKLALVHQLEGNWPAAERELQAVLDRDPENVEFMLRLGILHTEHFTKARTDAERTTAANEATRWLNRVLEAQPENAIASRALERLKVR
ncbi:MAG: tetratricopeptide repeat protein [Myxococcaceae bacterium]